MASSIHDLIEAHGTLAVAAATGFPPSTISRWKKENEIGGKGIAQELKAERFFAAIKKLERERAKPSRKAA
jgi:hypothetical protein